MKIKSNEWEQTGKGGTAETKLNLHAIVYLACSADVKPCRRQRGLRATDLISQISKSGDLTAMIPSSADKPICRISGVGCVRYERLEPVSGIFLADRVAEKVAQLVLVGLHEPLPIHPK